MQVRIRNGAIVAIAAFVLSACSPLQKEEPPKDRSTCPTGSLGGECHSSGYLAEGAERCRSRSGNRSKGRRAPCTDDDRGEGRADDSGRRRFGCAGGCGEIPPRFDSERRKLRPVRQRPRTCSRMAQGGGRILRGIGDCAGRPSRYSGDLGLGFGSRQFQHHRRHDFPAQHRTWSDARSRSSARDRQSDRYRNAGRGRRLDVCPDDRGRARRPLGTHL